ncbi:MAG TPA: hypothetical protein VKQ29_13350 [Aliidongia sp.]|nr:hypothetical protein [Aliidongia sp.]
MFDSQATAPRWGPNRTILIAGLAAAIIEMLVVLPVQAALGVPPLLVFQSIASGWQGDAAYDGGVPSALFGLALHLFISVVAAGIFVHASRLWPILVARYLSAGLIYGTAVYAVMNYLVLPLSAFSFKPAHALSLTATNFAVHLFFFGLPISLVTRFAARRAPR